MVVLNAVRFELVEGLDARLSGLISQEFEWRFSLRKYVVV